jgi:hypothetical protein
MDSDDQHSFNELLTPRARNLVGRELAQTAARRELIVAGADRSSGVLVLLLPLARVLGISVAEMQRASSYSRQTIYNFMDADPIRALPASEAERVAKVLTIALVGAGGPQTIEQLASALNADPQALGPGVRFLVSQGRASMDRAEGGSITLAADPSATEWLRLEVSTQELADRRPGYAIYIAAPPEDLGTLAAAIKSVVGLDEAAVLQANVAPSLMNGPEVAVNVRAGDQRSALRAAASVWAEICARAGVEAPMQVTQVIAPPIAPNAASPVLDNFLAALSEGLSPELADDLRAERERYPGGDAERRIAARCLTWAARSLRRSLGREDADRVLTIGTGDDAFEELIPVSGQLSLTPAQKKIKDPLQQGLLIAAERLGPFRGGELSSFKGPGETPRLVAKVAPSEDDLGKIARLSGQALNAGDHDTGYLRRVVRAVVDAGE